MLPQIHRVLGSSEARGRSCSSRRKLKGLHLKRYSVSVGATGGLQQRKHARAAGLVWDAYGALKIMKIVIIIAKGRISVGDQRKGRGAGGGRGARAAAGVGATGCRERVRRERCCCRGPRRFGFGARALQQRPLVGPCTSRAMGWEPPAAPDRRGLGVSSAGGLRGCFSVLWLCGCFDTVRGLRVK